MESRIATAKIEDLLDIFDPDAQEDSDVGDARILYVFDSDGVPQRVRVGSAFILDVASPAVSFFVSVPVEGNIEEGTISFAETPQEARERYNLTNKDLQEVIQVVYSDVGEDEINNLLA